MDRGAWWATVQGVTQSLTGLCLMSVGVIRRYMNHVPSAQCPAHRRCSVYTLNE